MSDIKTVTVSHEATIAKGTRRRRRKGVSGGAETTGTKAAKGQEISVSKHGGETRKHQSGGTSPGTSVQIEANKPIAEGPPKFVDSQPSDLNKPPSQPAPVNSPTTITQGLPQIGGKKVVKVVLEKSKKKPTRVVLQPAKVKKLGAQPAKHPEKTRKVAKKIRVSLHGLNKRVTRANTISKDAKQDPIEKVKKTLVEAKLIKADSKAPEDILRKMYRDYMLLKNRAL